MTPSARLAAVIEILDEIASRPGPADAIFANYVRARRFIGSKDRADIAERVFGIFRRRARLAWWLERHGAPLTARLLVLADLLVVQGIGPDRLHALFGGGRYEPAPLRPEEAALGGALAGKPLEHEEMPERVRLECPEWAEQALRSSLGASFATELRALQAPAAVDLRVNVLKASRDEARSALARDGIVTVPTGLSPWGLRAEGRPAISATTAFRDGLVEVQDEGSQILAYLLDARPGMQAVDFCAGAGGKTLAIAATMANKGRVIACDISGRRLDRAGIRLRRAGAHNVERRPLKTERDPWVKRHKGMFDRVLVDAPCSGVGTWRRNPDARWNRLGPDLDELAALQRSILTSAARLVKPGGRLLYATCSMLRRENEDCVDAFLQEHPGFRPVPPPAGLSCGSDKWLRLTPARHGTDGFFAALMERSPA